MSRQELDAEHGVPDASPAPAEAVCAPNACAADPLALLGALTLGIGVGALSGQALQPIAIWLVVGGCLVHGWGMVRGTLTGLSHNERSGSWVTIINAASWIVIAGLAVAATIAAGRAP